MAFLVVVLYKKAKEHGFLCHMKSFGRLTDEISSTRPGEQYFGLKPVDRHSWKDSCGKWGCLGKSKGQMLVQQRPLLEEQLICLVFSSPRLRLSLEKKMGVKVSMDESGLCW